MAYHPGSFSKNFAWHGSGLQKLHTVIRNGFNNTLFQIDRQTFREDAGIQGSIILIPINFFLHNRDGYLSVDELVFRAIQYEHCLEFDRLALFALNLNRVGSGRDRYSGRNIVPRPAMWANEFVRKELWSRGAWQASAFKNSSLDSFLEDRIIAQPEVRTKCRSNLKHLFQLCKYIPTGMATINSGAEQWVASALFLAWDRHILDGGTSDDKTLLELINSDELYKLLGVPKTYAFETGRLLLNLYKTAGYLQRLKPGKSDELQQIRDTHIPELVVPEDVIFQWLDQESSDSAVRRRIVERQEQQRDRRKSAALKRHYDNRCQFCAKRLPVSESQYYSEAAHIRGLGDPHHGPDATSNMLILCPNHHLQFDRGVLRLRKIGSHYQILSKSNGDPLNGKMIEMKHGVSDNHVQYHYRWFD